MTHNSGLMETLRLLTALQQWGGCINLSALKPLKLVMLGKMQVGINVRERAGTFESNFSPHLDEGLKPSHMLSSTENGCASLKLQDFQDKKGQRFSDCFFF